uniref:Uncharacterized protein n=1 Tax=Daphnia galeata TaxID=27404 RepID=A0A8J2RJK4_9CRUS|nr:unnamed protein product [Daphnia galeata]
MATNFDLINVMKKLPLSVFPLQTLDDVEDVEMCFQSGNTNSTTNIMDFKQMLSNNFETTNLHDRKFTLLVNSRFDMVFSNKLRKSLAMDQVSVGRPTIIGQSLIYTVIEETLIKLTDKCMKLTKKDVKTRFRNWLQQK